MLARFSRKMTRHHGLTGISRTDDGICLAHVVNRGDSKPRLTTCEFLPGAASGAPNTLREECRRHGLYSSRAVCALNPGDYQLLQVVPPDVPETEMREALRWQIHDMVDFPLDEAVIDVFQVLRGHQREGARTAYVVVAHQTLIQQRAAMMRETPLKIQAIDIPELVLRNLVRLHPDAERGVAFIYFGTDSGLLLIVRGQELCLARNLPIGLTNLADGSNPEQTIEVIALEIQRSLDFHERIFAQAPIGSLLIAPQQFDENVLLSGLRSALGIKVGILDLEEILECADMPAERPDRSLLAIGAALRSGKGGA